VLLLARLKLMGFAIPRAAFSIRRNTFFSAFVKRVTDILTQLLKDQMSETRWVVFESRSRRA
jgi:hypothetical protein